MKLFGKKEEKQCCCSCKTEKLEEAVLENKDSQGIKVLGSGCKKCNQLEENVVAALTELKMDPTVDHVTDFAKIAAYGVMSTPALVVDGKVVSFGKVLTKEEAIAILKEVRG